MKYEQWWQDLRLAWRGLSRSRGFSFVGVVTLALGIAGTTAMFAMVHGILLRPLPVRDQDRLLVAWKELHASGFAHYPFGSEEIESVRRTSSLLESVAGVDANGVAPSVVVEHGVSTYVKVALVTGAFFDVLGAQPVIGRSFARSDDDQGAEPVLVISHGLWRRRYGAAPEVVGRRIRLADQAFTIVGVMPPGLDYPRGVEVWRTTSSVPLDAPFGDAARQELDLLARLSPGATLEQAAGELSALTRRLESEAPPEQPRGLVPVVRSLETVVVGDVRTGVLALFAAVTLVLLIAGANVANLLLMRGETRRAEVALRTALGATRGRIAGQVFAESLLLGLAAGAAGLVVASAALQALLAFIPEGLPRGDAVRIDTTVVLFSTVAAVVGALLAGLAPAVSSLRHDPGSLLRGAGTGVTRSPVRRMRRALVVVQVALAVTVLSGAGLLTRTVLQLHSIDTGFPADHLVLIDLAVPQSKHADQTRHARFLDDLIARLEAAPQILAATPVNVPPFSGEGGWDVPRFTAEGQSADRAAANASLNLESVHPNYFETFQVRLVRGRAFTESDRAGALDVAIVSEEVARQTWPGQDPIGRRLKMGGTDSTAPWYTVIGVAASTRYRDLARPRPTLYLPAAQFQMTARMLAVRTMAPVEVTAGLARDAVRSVDADVQVVRIAPFTEMLERPLARPRFNAFLLGTFGAAALLLAGIGLYGVMAAYVRQRDREIAIRLALGATVNGVRRLVLAEALRLALAGIIAGLAAAVVSARVLRGLLFGVQPLDPASFAGAAVLLVLVCALASLLPAWRATRANPIEALRAE